MTAPPSTSTDATATLNSTCCKCGRDPRDTGADWAQCRSCGKVYCTVCIAERRLTGASTLCPCCGGGEFGAAG